MSDAAIASMVTGLVTIATLTIGFLTLWVKLRYGVQQAEQAKVMAGQVQDKLDHNTAITVQAKESADQAGKHVAECDAERVEMRKMLASHDARIGSLETQMTALRVSVDSASKNVDSTRHEMRGHLQTVMTKLDLLGMAGAKPAQPSA